MRGAVGGCTFPLLLRGVVLGGAPRFWCEVLLNQLLINGGALVLLAGCCLFLSLLAGSSPPPGGVPSASGDFCAHLLWGFGEEGGVGGSSPPCTRWQQPSSPSSGHAAQPPAASSSQPAGTASSTGCASTGAGIWGVLEGSPLAFFPPFLLSAQPVPACRSLPACLLPPHHLLQPGPCKALEETKTEPN